jgi:hypothetical protein
MIYRALAEIFGAVVLLMIASLLTLDGTQGSDSPFPSTGILYFVFVAFFWGLAVKLKLSKIGLFVSIALSMIYVASHAQVDNCVSEGKIRHIEFYIASLDAIRWAPDLPEDVLNAFRSGEIFLHYDLDSYDQPLPAELAGMSNLIVHVNPLDDLAKAQANHLILKQCWEQTVTYEILSLIP